MEYWLYNNMMAVEHNAQWYLVPTWRLQILYWPDADSTYLTVYLITWPDADCTTYCTCDKVLPDLIPNCDKLLPDLISTCDRVLPDLIPTCNGVLPDLIPTCARVLPDLIPTCGRVLPDLSLENLRDEITSQLDPDTCPAQYIFIRNVGRHFTTVRCSYTVQP